MRRRRGGGAAEPPGRVAVRVAVPGAAAWGPAEGAHCLRELLKHLLYLRGQVRLASPGGWNGRRRRGGSVPKVRRVLRLVMLEHRTAPRFLGRLSLHDAPTFDQRTRLARLAGPAAAAGERPRTLLSRG